MDSPTIQTTSAAPGQFPPETVLSALQAFASHEALDSQSLHPFASSPGVPTLALRELMEATKQVTQSLHSHLSLPLSNPKQLSLYRQHATIAHTIALSDQNIQQTLTSFRKRAGITYGEDIPLDRSLMVDWCVKCVEAWAASAGMETFREEEQEGRMTVVLGGKVLVIDIYFSVDRSSPDSPVLDVASLKTSYAIPNGVAGATTEGSRSLDGFLADSLRAFLREVQKDTEVQDNVGAARLSGLLADHLAYLMKLDHLALSEGDSGLRWFRDLDNLALRVEEFAMQEAEVLSAGMGVGVSAAPLDLFLMRGHALPLHYLTTPSLSFLTYLSPSAYLSLLRSSASSPPFQDPRLKLPRLDVPLSHLRSRFASHSLPLGATVASLVLTPQSNVSFLPDSIGMPTLASRPTFPLLPSGADVDHELPHISELSAAALTSASRWVLDFTGDGKYRGVVMSQSRMREVELIVNPFSGMDHINSAPMMSFGTGSWLDLLVNPDHPISSERYTALYACPPSFTERACVSPTSVHPPLQLRLSAPDEPGFVLERVPVRTLKEVWGVLEIVREQCWLNETLLACQWIPEGLDLGGHAEDLDIMPASEDELQAILAGTLNPRRIPVNIHLPSEPVSDPLFESAGLGALGQQPGRAKIVMSAPERPPMSGLVEITVAFDPARARGVALDIRGAMGADIRLEALEEACRRGGVFGLPGRVWSKAHSGG
ncbi:hypothetical protein CERSUDRAFT_141813 [Gelatoporia subvermispora B]|uniref:Mediator complex subunit 1 n=1 Tax=Ceriporiopsis subvermispora (strain B) TaxID=914234 RepID=M2R605_CERS8|nr:hypothetical protein CERSUDRAFT_141813 [Gelatoporia subvermispora B]